MTLEQAHYGKDLARQKLFKEVSGVLQELCLSLQDVAGSQRSLSAGARSSSASDAQRPILSFQLPPTMHFSNGNIDWRIPPGMSKVGHAMKNAEFVREWKISIDNLLSRPETLVSSKVSEEGPEDLLQYWENESRYWAEPMTLLKSPQYRAVLLTCRADRSLNRQWKSTMGRLSQQFACAHDCTKFLRMMSSFFTKLHIKCSIDAAHEVLSQLVYAAHASFSMSRYGHSTHIMTMMFARVSNRLIEMCKFNLQSGQLWKMVQQDACATNKKLRCCIELLEEYPCIFKMAQEESASSYVDQPPPVIDRSIVFARTKIFSERLKKLLDITDAQAQFDSAIATGIDGLLETVGPFRDQLNAFCSKITSPLNMSGCLCSHSQITAVS